MSSKRHFDCPSCHRKIFIPEDLPATVAPCPHCSENVTSPELEKPLPPKWTPSKESSEKEAEKNDDEPDVIEISSDETTDDNVVVAPDVQYKSSQALPYILAALLLAVCVGGFFLIKSQTSPSANNSNEASKTNQLLELKEAKYLNRGWKVEASDVFRKFMDAQSVSEKATYVLQTPGVEQRMKQFYSEHGLREGNLPIEPHGLISIRKERNRGLFLMTYDRPEQFILNELFRPIAPLYVVSGIEAPDEALAALSRVKNFQEQAVRSRVFFRKTEDGLKIDWDTYVQTRFRLLKKFIDNPSPGKSEVFRVLISEEVTEKKSEKLRGVRTFKLADSAHFEDFVQVKMPESSPIAQHIQELLPEAYTNALQPEGKLATVEITWSNERIPQPVLSRFICWEFYGLGNLEADDIANPR